MQVCNKHDRKITLFCDILSILTTGYTKQRISIDNQRVTRNARTKVHANFWTTIESMTIVKGFVRVAILIFFLNQLFIIQKLWKRCFYCTTWNIDWFKRLICNLPINANKFCVLSHEVLRAHATSMQHWHQRNLHKIYALLVNCSN